MRQHHRHFRAIVLICIFLLHHQTLASPVFGPQFLTGGTGRNIRHLPCVSRRTGETGICMFAFTCAKANGTHLGTCIDRFYFGSCCRIDSEPDIFTQDNTIDIDNPLSISKPFATTTTIHTFESNDIPGNVDKPKPSTRPAISAATVSSVTIVTDSTTVELANQTKVKPSKIGTKKPIAIESTTESIRLSTFQTVQNASEQRPTVSPTTPITSTSRRPQRPNISNFKPVTSKPKPTSSTPAHPPWTSNNASATNSTNSLTSAFPISSRPSLHPITSTPAVNHSIVSKKPYATAGHTRRPILTFGSTIRLEYSGTTKPNLPTTRRNATTTSTTVSLTNKTSILEDSGPVTIPNLPTVSKIPSATRFPPRNVTAAITTFVTEFTSQPISTTATSVTFKDPNPTTKPLTTRKPITTKKPIKYTTKRPIVSKKPPTSSITTRRPALTTNVVSTTPASTKITILNSTSTTTKATIPSSIVTSSSTSTSTIINPTKKPLTIPPIKRTTTKRPVITTSPRATTTSRRPTIASTIKRPIITVSKKNITSSAPALESTTSFKPANVTKTTTTTTTSPPPSSKATTSRPHIDFTTDKPTTLKITSSTTLSSNETANPIIKYTISTGALTTSSTTTTTKITTPSTTTTTSKSTTSPSTPNDSITKPSGHIHATSDSFVTSKKNVTTSPWNASTATTMANEIDTEQTTMIPGIVTWMSFPDDVESATKNPDLSSILPETTETDWTPITTPDGWIIIQSPTTDNFDSEVHLDVKPVTATTQVPLILGKPTTDSTTTKRTTSTTTQPTTTTQSTTYVDMLSTIASVTITSAFTETPSAPLNMSNFKDVCGRRLFPESRIVGGDGSSFGKWPWQISLRQWRTSTYLHKCGAALLNENWAITAAHCVQNVLPSDLLLRIGEHDLGNEEEPYGFQERRVQIVASHPNFDPRTFEFDLALMRFYEPVLPFQPNVLPICVPDDDEDYVGQTAFVTGWGRLYEDGPLPSVLQEVAVPVINNSVCEGMYRNAGYIEHIPHIFICAGWRKGGFDSCEGDSGGPLVIQRKRDKRWILAGVISWGIGCAEPNQPGVYTRISEFREWINQILQF